MNNIPHTSVVINTPPAHLAVPGPFVGYRVSEPVGVDLGKLRDSEPNVVVGRCEYCKTFGVPLVFFLAGQADCCWMCYYRSGASTYESVDWALESLNSKPIEFYTKPDAATREGAQRLVARCYASDTDIKPVIKQPNVVKSRHDGLNVTMSRLFEQDLAEIFRPRVSNTGAEKIKEETKLPSITIEETGVPIASDYTGVLPFLDWVSGSCHGIFEGEVPDVQEILRFLSAVPGLQADTIPHWEKLPYSWQQYTTGYKRGGIMVWCGGDDQVNEPGCVDNTVMVKRPKMPFISISATGIRELEGLGIASDTQKFCQELRDMFGFRCTRLDPAMDDFSGNINIDVIEKYLTEGHYTCRAKRKKQVNGQMFERIQVTYTIGGGKTIYVGDRQSRSFLRMYQKGYERLEKLPITPDEETMALFMRWVRVEPEYKDTQAQAAFEAICENGMVGVVGMLRAYLDFKDPNDTYVDKSKRTSAKWWADFLGNVERAKFATAPRPIRTMERSMAWVKKQVAPVLAVLCAAGGYGQHALAEIVADGYQRWKPCHVSMLLNHQWDWEHRKEIRREPVSFADITNPNNFTGKEQA